MEYENLITEAQQQVAKLNGAKKAFEENGIMSAARVAIDAVAVLDEMCEMLEKGQEENKCLRKILCNACDNRGWERMDNVAACNCCDNGEYFTPAKSRSSSLRGE
jgi:hypothetical protein